MWKPTLMLPRWAPTQGGFLGVVLLAVVRSIFAPGVMPGETDRYARWIMNAYLAAAALFASVGLWLVWAGALRIRIAACFLIVGAAYLVYVYRCADLRAVTYWYYGSLLPAVLILLEGAPVYPYWVPLFIVLVAELNARRTSRVIGSK